jgi:integrase
MSKVFGYWRGESPRVVMEIAGHSAIEVTANVYGHLALDSQGQSWRARQDSNLRPAD